MNRRLQKWAERKRKTLIKWAEEYDKLLAEEGIKGGHIVSLALDRNYVSEINAFKVSNKNLGKSTEYLIHTKGWLKEGKNESN